MNIVEMTKAVVGIATLLTLIPAEAQYVRVTMSLDKNVTQPGARGMLYVWAQIEPAYRARVEGIFSWYVDLLAENTNLLHFDIDRLQKGPSDQNPKTSSPGTLKNGNIIGVSDTFINALAQEKVGVETNVLLFSVPFTVLDREGTTAFSVTRGSGIPNLSADFLVAPIGGGNPLIGGVYSSAAALLAIRTDGHVPSLNIPIVERKSGANVITLSVAPPASLDGWLVEFTTNVASSSWLRLPAPTSTDSFVHTNAAPVGFYRLRPDGDVPSLNIPIVERKSGANVITLSVVPPGSLDGWLVEFTTNVASRSWLRLSAPASINPFVHTNAAPEGFYRLVKP